MSLVDDVRTLVDEPTGGVFWTDQHVYDAINWELIRAYFDEKGTRKITASMTITSSSPFVGLPATIAIPTFIVFGGQEYWPTSYTELERWQENWRGEDAAQPKAFIPWDHRTFRVWPQADATYVMTVHGLAYPTEIAAGNLDITEPTTFKSMITFRSAASLLQATLPMQSQVYEVQAKELEHKWNKHSRNFRGNQKLDRLRPANAFLARQHGNPALFKLWN